MPAYILSSRLTDTKHPGSVHSATLGKGNSDDTLIKIKNGDMDNKGEVAMVFGKQVSANNALRFNRRRRRA